MKTLWEEMEDSDEQREFILEFVQGMKDMGFNDSYIGKSLALVIWSLEFPGEKEKKRLGIK